MSAPLHPGRIRPALPDYPKCALLACTPALRIASFNCCFLLSYVQ